jgi:hypothetical protein
MEATICRSASRFLANLRGLISSWWCVVLLTCGRELGSSAWESISGSPVSVCPFSWSKGDLSCPLCRLRLPLPAFAGDPQLTGGCAISEALLLLFSGLPLRRTKSPTSTWLAMLRRSGRVEKARPDCFYHFTFRVLSANCKDFCVIFFFLLVLAVTCNSTTGN